MLRARTFAAADTGQPADPIDDAVQPPLLRDDNRNPTFDCRIM